MKHKAGVTVKNVLSKTALAFTWLLVCLHSVAQDKKVDINVNTKSDDGGSFFNQPWVWVVGGAVFLLLLVALLRNNNSKS